MDCFRGYLRYNLHLLIGFNGVKVDHGGRLTAMRSVWAMVVVEGDLATDANLSLRAGLPSLQIDALILQGPLKAFYEDVVEAMPYTVHQDPAAAPFHPVAPGE